MSSERSQENFASPVRAGQQNSTWLKASGHMGAAIILVTWLIFFWRIIFGGQLYFLDDLKIIYYPLEYIYQQAQLSWHLPIWSPYFGFGQPLLAWGQLGFFTPLHLVLRFLHLNPLILLNISTAVYNLIGLFGMYLFLRRSRLSQMSAALGSIVFGFSGFTIGHLNHVNFYTATMLLPWLLISIEYFLKKPTLPRAALLALVAAAIPLSGQPQISLYTFIIATIYGLIIFIGRFLPLTKGEHSPPWRGEGVKILILTFLSAVVAICLSSFSLLPLKEFLPISDRGSDLPISELYEFSYPPQHAITLLFPYYFGNHEIYWGAKNFQELAAYVGVLPLLLGVVGLFSWRKHLALYLTGILLLLIAFTMAPGQYSPIYTYFVENHILTSLAIPGRFVYFFDVGVLILATLGLEQLLRLRERSQENFASPVRAGQHNSAWLKVSVGFAIVTLTSANLLWWGWDYNPLYSAKDALAPSPFTETLRNYEEQAGLPARLYANETLPLQGVTAAAVQPTEPISPTFTVYQPLHLEESTTCVALPLTVTTTANPTEITLTLSDNLNTSPFFTQTVASKDIPSLPVIRLCSPEISARRGREIVLSLNSEKLSTIQAFQRLPVGSEERALYVRVEDPTSDQLERSRKLAHLVISQDQPSGVDLEKELLLRHIQVTANSSAARWISALSIGDFRAFIEQFFANDHDPIDGEGLHALTRFRNLVNMAGITHLAQAVPDYQKNDDPVLGAGYKLEQEVPVGSTRLRLYTNPEAFPKAFLVGTGVWETGADQTRFGLSQPGFDGSRLVFVTGPTPTETGIIGNSDNLEFSRYSRTAFEQGKAEITRYDQTQVDIAVETPEAAWLVLNDSSTPEWHTFIDEQETPYYVANSVFRTAYVPAGKHTVSFRYISPAINQAKMLTAIGLVVTILLLASPYLRSRNSSS